MIADSESSTADFCTTIVPSGTFSRHQDRVVRGGAPVADGGIGIGYRAAVRNHHPVAAALVTDSESSIEAFSNTIVPSGAFSRHQDRVVRGGAPVADGGIGIDYLAAVRNHHPIVPKSATTDPKVPFPSPTIRIQQRSRSRHEDRVAAAAVIGHVNTGSDRLPTIGHRERVSGTIPAQHQPVTVAQERVAPRHQDRVVGGGIGVSDNGYAVICYLALIGNDQAVTAARATHGEVAAVGQDGIRVEDIQCIGIGARIISHEGAGVGVGPRSEVGRHAGGVRADVEVLGVGDWSEEHGDAKRRSKGWDVFHGHVFFRPRPTPTFAYVVVTIRGPRPAHPERWQQVKITSFPTP